MEEKYEDVVSDNYDSIIDYDDSGKLNFASAMLLLRILTYLIAMTHFVCC